MVHSFREGLQNFISSHHLFWMANPIDHLKSFILLSGKFIKVIFWGVCSFMSYLLANICSLPHDCYIFTCNKILDKKLQETFVLEIKNDKLKK